MSLPPPKLRVLIADDEALSRDCLRRFLQEEPNVELVAECSTGTEVLKVVEQNAVDLAFLDIGMPELDGFGVLEKLNEPLLPAVIFVTAHSKFALRAFEKDAVDYLLKPFDQTRFRNALQRARHRLTHRPSAQRHSAASARSPSSETNSRTLERFCVKSSGRIILLKTVDVEWISAADNYVELHVANKAYLLRDSVSAMAEKLAGSRFARISRSRLVNLEFVREIHSNSHGDYTVILHNGTKLPGSRKYRAPLRKMMGITGGR